MPRIVFLFLCLLAITHSYSQDIQRIEITGKIVADTTNDIEGVTVYNTSSNQGTITNAEGDFKIKVQLNDIVEIAALQFENFTVTIDPKIIDSRNMTVFLIEQVNKLDEVVILPYDLSGNLVTDIKSVKTFNPDLDAIYFGLNDITVYEFGDDYKSGVKNTVLETGVDNVFGADLFQIVSLLVDAIFPPKNKKNYNIDRRELSPSHMPDQDLRDYYSTEFIAEAFNVEENLIEAFIAFTESNKLDYSLIKKGRELEFLDLVKQQSDLFLKTHRD